MTTSTLHPLAAEYLERLRRLSVRLPHGRRDELVTEIEGYLQEAIKPTASDAEALTVLDRLGEPEQIIDAEQPRAAPVVRQRGAQEWAAIFLLLLGGFFAGLGWVLGVVLLWSSRAWTRREKLIGTLIVPGGLALVSFLFFPLTIEAGGVCSGPHDCAQGSPSTIVQVLIIALLALLVIAPVSSAIFLARRAQHAKR